LKKARAERDKLLGPPDPAIVASARKDVADAQAGVERAASRDSGPNAPKVSDAERQSRQDAADFALQAARAQLDALLKGPDKATVEPASMAVDTAEATLAGAQAQRDELLAPPTQVQIASAANAVDVARLALQAAEAHLAELTSHPTAEELRVAQKQVDDAQAALERAASPMDDGATASGTIAPGSSSGSAQTTAQSDSGPSLADQLTLQHALEQQQVQLRSLQQQVAASELRAPFDGQVESVQVKSGDAVEARRVVVVLASPEAPVVLATLSEADAARLPLGTTVRLQVEASTAKLQGMLAAYADSSAAARQATIRVAWPDSPPPFGANVQIEATVGQKDSALLLPVRAATATRA